MKQRELLFRVILLVVVVACVIGWINAPVALCSGILINLFFGDSSTKRLNGYSKYLLQWSIVGLGFGINLFHAAEAGAKGLWLTVGSIAFTFVIGILLAKLLHIESKIAMLITSGTAICGGSAIAAVAPSIEASEEQTSLSLGAVFLLNAIALFLFPAVGKLLNMSHAEFGYWSAIAIHDTSSVVGAASVYGTDSLRIATTVKLERSLWIIPTALSLSYAYRSKKSSVKIPYFILFFVGAMVVGTYVKLPTVLVDGVGLVSKRALNVALLLIGTSLSVGAVKAVGFRPLLFAVAVWLLVAILAAILVLLGV